MKTLLDELKKISDNVPAEAWGKFTFEKTCEANAADAVRSLAELSAYWLRSPCRVALEGGNGLDIIRRALAVLEKCGVTP